MRSFVYENKEFYSLREFCIKYRVSYQKLRRLCRHYKRASEDPAVACNWIVKNIRPPVNEPKTFKYYQDLEKTSDRQRNLRARISEMIDREF